MLQTHYLNLLVFCSKPSVSCKGFKSGVDASLSISSETRQPNEASSLFPLAHTQMLNIVCHDCVLTWTLSDFQTWNKQVCYTHELGEGGIVQKKWKKQQKI